MKDLQEFLHAWNQIPYPKPEENPEFLPLFIEFLEDPGTVVQPDGEGAYFGKQAIVTEDIAWGGPVIELAYDQNHMVIYTGCHSGYWVAPFVTLKAGDPEFAQVAKALRNKIIQFIGLDMLNVE